MVNKSTFGGGAVQGRRAAGYAIDFGPSQFLGYLASSSNPLYLFSMDKRMTPSKWRWVIAILRFIMSGELNFSGYIHPDGWLPDSPEQPKTDSLFSSTAILSAGLGRQANRCFPNHTAKSFQEVLDPDVWQKHVIWGTEAADGSVGFEEGVFATVAKRLPQEEKEELLAGIQPDGWLRAGTVPHLHLYIEVYTNKLPCIEASIKLDQQAQQEQGYLYNTGTTGSDLKTRKQAFERNKQRLKEEAAQGTRAELERWIQFDQSAILAPTTFAAFFIGSHVEIPLSAGCYNPALRGDLRKAVQTKYVQPYYPFGNPEMGLGVEAYGEQPHQEDRFKQFNKRHWSSQEHGELILSEERLHGHLWDMDDTIMEQIIRFRLWLLLLLLPCHGEAVRFQAYKPLLAHLPRWDHQNKPKNQGDNRVMLEHLQTLEALFHQLANDPGPTERSSLQRRVDAEIQKVKDCVQRCYGLLQQDQAFPTGTRVEWGMGLRTDDKDGFRTLGDLAAKVTSQAVDRLGVLLVYNHEIWGCYPRALYGDYALALTDSWSKVVSDRARQPGIQYIPPQVITSVVYFIGVINSLKLSRAVWDPAASRAKKENPHTNKAVGKLGLFRLDRIILTIFQWQMGPLQKRHPSVDADKPTVEAYMRAFNADAALITERATYADIRTAQRDVSHSMAEPQQRTPFTARLALSMRRAIAETIHPHPSMQPALVLGADWNLAMELGSLKYPSGCDIQQLCRIGKRWAPAILPHVFLHLVVLEALCCSKLPIDITIDTGGDPLVYNGTAEAPPHQTPARTATGSQPKDVLYYMAPWALKQAKVTALAVRNPDHPAGDPAEDERFMAVLQGADMDAILSDPMAAKTWSQYIEPKLEVYTGKTALIRIQRVATVEALAKMITGRAAFFHNNIGKNQRTLGPGVYSMVEIYRAYQRSYGSDVQAEAYLAADLALILRGGARQRTAACSGVQWYCMPPTGILTGNLAPATIMVVQSHAHYTWNGLLESKGLTQRGPIQHLLNEIARCRREKQRQQQQQQQPNGSDTPPDVDLEKDELWGWVEQHQLGLGKREERMARLRVYLTSALPQACGHHTTWSRVAAKLNTPAADDNFREWWNNHADHHFFPSGTGGLQQLHVEDLMDTHVDWSMVGALHHAALLLACVLCV
jgi:hypothetical protein